MIKKNIDSPIWLGCRQSGVAQVFFSIMGLSMFVWNTLYFLFIYCEHLMTSNKIPISHSPLWNPNMCSVQWNGSWFKFSIHVHKQNIIEKFSAWIIKSKLVNLEGSCKTRNEEYLFLVLTFGVLTENGFINSKFGKSD